MGTFDYVSCKLNKYEFDNWQTKGLGCQMNLFFIDMNGFFMIRDQDAVYVPWLQTQQFKVYNIVQNDFEVIERAYEVSVKNGRVMSLMAYADKLYSNRIIND